MKILLGVDTSAYSRETVASTCRIPWPKGTLVVVLSAIAPQEHQFAPQPHVLAAVAGNMTILKEDAVKTHEDLVTEAEQTLRTAGLETRSRMVDGDPRHLIVETARSEGVDLIVVGSHGHSGFGRLLLGSVASYVVAHASCNVLVIKRDVTHAWN